MSGNWSAGVVGFSESISHGIGVQGFGLATSGEAYGVWGKSYALDGAGVYGEGNSYGGYFTSTNGYGAYGTSYDLDGVRGVSTGGGMADNGVYGETNSTSSWEAGVYGYSSDAAAGVKGVSDLGNGVYGASPSQGMYGYAYAYTGTTTGGYFVSASDAGRGVYGWNFADTGNTYGVVGDCVSSSGTGVFGWASRALTATNTGVYGYAQGIYTNTAGVKGYAPATSGNPTWGVYGQSDSNGGAGVMAYNYWYGTGLRAQSWGGDIIQGYSGDPGYDVLRFYVDNSGNISTTGNIDAAGTKSAVVSTSDYGTRRLYAIESPEVWFEDFGTGQLVNGEITVTFDPIFAQTVNLTETYHVFLTPLSDEAVLLFVTDKSPSSFTVRGVTLDGQPASAAFDYRIVAKRLGYEDLRLEPASAPTPGVQMQKAPRPKSEWSPFPPLPERPEVPVPPQEQGR